MGRRAEGAPCAGPVCPGRRDTAARAAPGYGRPPAGLTVARLAGRDGQAADRPGVAEDDRLVGGHVCHRDGNQRSQRVQQLQQGRLRVTRSEGQGEPEQLALTRPGMDRAPGSAVSDMTLPLKVPWHRRSGIASGTYFTEPL